METLRYYLDTISDATPMAWTVNFATNAWEAVQRGSGDLPYISSSTNGQGARFNCGDGPAPKLGFVSAIVFHYRVRVTGTTGAPDLAVGATRNGTLLSSDSITPSTTAWIDGEMRIHEDAVTSARFLSAGLDDLEAYFSVTTAPTTGEWQIAETWIEVEWQTSPESYDPYVGALPDAVLGDMTWVTTGTQAAAIASDRLRLTDSSTTDHRDYGRVLPTYSRKYITEVTSRFYLTSVTAGPSFVYRIARVGDSSRDIDLCCFKDASGNPYIGLSTGPADRDDPAAYKATYALDWTEDHHYRLVIDRHDEPGSSHDVKVYVDYSSTPVLDVMYEDFHAASASVLYFGTGDVAHQTSQVVAYIDFIAWWSYKRTGEAFRGWWDIEEDSNVVTYDNADSFIVPEVMITPPGITGGQSNQCCKLDVNVVADECSIRVYQPVLDSAHTYDLTIDYRQDVLGEDSIVTVQRTSDHYYWNNGGSAWQAAASSVTLTNAMLRTRLAVMTNIQTNVPDNLIVKVQNDTAGGTSAHNVYVYKVHLAL